MAKKILFPFAADTPYFGGYSWASELASKMNTDLLLFTASPSKDEQSLKTIHHSLLAAQGHHLQSVHHKDAKPAHIERWIETGDLKKSLLEFLKKHTSYITVLDPSLSTLDAALLAEVVHFSGGGVIVLPLGEKPFNDAHPNGTFYDNLQKAELYKLPQNFFDTLGNDRSLFNYLSSFFRKKKSGGSGTLPQEGKSKT